MVKADVGVPVEWNRLIVLHLPQGQPGMAIGDGDIRVIRIAARNGPTQRVGEEFNRLVEVPDCKAEVIDADGCYGA